MLPVGWEENSDSTNHQCSALMKSKSMPREVLRSLISASNIFLIDFREYPVRARNLIIIVPSEVSHMTRVLGLSMMIWRKQCLTGSKAQSPSVPESGVESFEPTRTQPIIQFEFFGKRKGMSRTTLKWEAK